MGAEASPLNGGALGDVLPRPAGCNWAAWLVDSCQGLEARLVALQRDGSGSPPQEAEDPPCERMTALYKERNAALRAELEAKEELLSRSEASMAAHQQERDKLQRKVMGGGLAGAALAVQSSEEPPSPLARCSDQGQVGRGGQESPEGPPALHVCRAPPPLVHIWIFSPLPA